MADISLIDPYSAQQESIARQRRMAQALQQQAQAPMEMPQTPGVLLSPYAGLAKVLQGVYGGYQEAQADKEYRALAEEARTNQAEDMAKLVGAIRAPARPEIAGQDAVMDMPERIIPGQTISQYGGTLNIPGQTIPKVAYQPAIAPQPARPAGYISPELIADIKDPTTRNLALAQLIKQAEPETFIKGSPGDVFFDRLGNKKFSIPAAAEKTILSPLGKLQSERAAIFASNPNDPRLATYDNAIAKESQDQNLVFQKEKFEYEKGNPGYTLEKVRNADGSESVMAVNKGSAVARTVVGADGKALTSAAPKTTPHYSEIEQGGNVVIIDMSLPAGERLANAQIKGPIRNNLEKIITTDASGREVSRYVDKGTLATLGDIPAPYKGFMSDLAEAGQLPANWQSIPQIAGLVRENLINKAGGITPKDLANLKVRIAEAASRLAYEGVPGFNPKDLTPPLSNFTTLSGGAPAPAAAAALKITTRAEIADAAKRSGKSIEEVTRDAVAKGYKVQ
jgi:hypothetical protein